MEHRRTIVVGVVTVCGLGMWAGCGGTEEVLEDTSTSILSAPTTDGAASEPTPVSMSIPTPAPSADVLCCACIYTPNRRCGIQPTPSACTAASPDCQWVGGSSTGTCMPRHMKDCNDWARANTDCDSTQILPYPSSPDFSSMSPACTDFRYNYEGHGLGCTNLVNRILVCIGTHPSCGSFDFQDTGCSVFDDLAAARAEVQRIVNSLGGSTCAMVSANQCTASNECQSRYVFSIDSTGICDESAGPCNDGGYCHDENAVSLCSTGSGITSQVCCNHRWHVGQRSCS